MANTGRWAGIRRAKQRKKVAPTTSKLYAQILANEALETKIQNETSPYPPTYTEHVSRRNVCTSAMYGHEIPKLRTICLTIAAKHFSSHILPSPVDGAHERRKSSAPQKRRRGDEDYLPDAEEVHLPLKKTDALQWTREEALWWNETNNQLLKQLPPQLADALLDQLCLHAPWSLTKDVLSAFFLPYAMPHSTKSYGSLPAGSRIRPRLFFPASLPLFSQDPKTASLLLSVLAGALALSPSAVRLAQSIYALDLHGLTRLQSASLTRLLRAPPNAGVGAWNLRRVTLPGCAAVGDAVVDTIIAVCGSSLEELDMTMTSVSARIDFNEDTFSAAVSAAVDASLHTLDVAHTAVGDIAIGGILRHIGPQLQTLHVGHTLVGANVALEALLSRLLVPKDGYMPSALTKLDLADMVEYARRHQSSLQGRTGISGNTLYAISRMVADAANARGKPLERVKMRGDKRAAFSASHWRLPTMHGVPYTLGDAMYMLTGSVTSLDVGGLALPAQDLERSCTETMIFPSYACLEELSLVSTALRDEALQTLVPWTGKLQKLFLDETQITLRARRGYFDDWAVRTRGT
ncbi:hypothetical protein MVES1_001988 [Malassezia vespertilionis]|uniref:uncharacterized protein n=1 Tax=Malassezia vespertilionis TaxID=2020962 RepID=UPI0024B09BAA|nr:uncharacterized protein MVES1_001988 [Malassezia vespertilionis]WFD06634.1 hypothetical protein MVES1_001988 [Malassezia vespertilionis]